MLPLTIAPGQKIAAATSVADESHLSFKKVHALALTVFIGAIAASIVYLLMQKWEWLTQGETEGNLGLTGDIGDLFKAIFPVAEGAPTALAVATETTHHALRSACTNLAGAVAIGNALSYTGSFVSHTLAQAAKNGYYLQAWVTAGSVVSRIVTTAFAPGSITTTAFTSPGSGALVPQILVAPHSVTGYLLIAIYSQGGTFTIEVDSKQINAAGIIVSSRTDTITADGQLENISASLVSLSTGNYIFAWVSSTSFTKAPTFWTYSGGVPTGYYIDSTLVSNSQVAADAVSSDSFVAFWLGSGGVNGKVLDMTANVIVATTLVSSESVTGLACAVLSNPQNVVAVWINTATHLLEYQIFSTATLGPVSSLTVLDAVCAVGAESVPKVKKLRDGFLVTYLNGGNLYGYYVGSNGVFEGGRTLLNNGNSATQTLPVLASMAGASQFYAGWAENGASIVTRPFQVNQPPTIATQTANQVVYVNSALSLNLTSTFTDVDLPWGDALNFTLKNRPAWLGFNALLQLATGTAPQGSQGSYMLTYVATDALNTTTSDVFTLTVPDRSPIVNGTLSNQQINVGQLWNYLLPNLFSDPDGDPLTLSVTPGFYSFVSQMFSWTPVSGNQGTQIVNVTANDGFGGITSTSFSLTVLNRAPVVVGSISTQTVYIGSVWNLLVSSGIFSDPDGDTLTYTATAGPFSFSNGAFSWTPVSGNQGTRIVVVTANDGFGGTNNVTFSLVVPNRSPQVVGSISNQQVFIGAVWNLLVSSNFYDPDGDPLTYIGTAGPYTFSNGAFSWTPVSGNQGTRTIMVTANDGFGGMNSTSFSLTVPNRAPVVSTQIADQNVHLGNSLSVPTNGAFIDPDGDSLVYGYSLVNGNPLPNWISSTQTGLSGVPVSVNEGVSNIKVTATDPYLASTFQSFNVTAYDNAPVPNGVLPSQQVLIGSPINYVVPSSAFTDIDGETLTLSLSGTLPPGITFNAATGTFSGTPPLNGGIGTYNFQVIATDPFGKSGSQPFSIQVTSNPPAAVAAPTNFQVTAGSSFYFSLLNVFSDPLSLTYSVSGLPGWLELNNGILSGSPPSGSSAVGTTTLMITAADAYKSTTISVPLTVASQGSGGGTSPQVGAPIYDITQIEGTPFRFTIPTNAFTGGVGSLSLTATLSDGTPLPNWLTFVNGTFSGDAPTIGIFKILVRESDQNGGSALQSFNLNINAPVTAGPDIANPPSDFTAYTGVEFNQFVGNIFVGNPNLTATISQLWLQLQGQYLLGTPGLSDGDANVLLNGTNSAGFSSSVRFTVLHQGENSESLSLQIVFPVLGAIGFAFTVYRLRHQIVAGWIYLKHKVWRCISPIMGGTGESTIEMVPFTPISKAVATVGMEFSVDIDLQSIPPIKGAEKYLVIGEAGFGVDNTFSAELPNWLIPTISPDRKNLKIAGIPSKADMGQVKLKIVGYKGGVPSYYPLTIDVDAVNISGQRQSFAALPSDFP